ncbi:MAG: PQQ-binding-like beta-propeller repeat protein, partial [Planctomycetaceae bacterium]
MSRVSRASGWGRLARRAGWGPLLLALVAWGGPAAKGDDWPQFLGPNRTGISQETGLISAWPAEGLPELWRVAGGVGMSGVSVVGDRAVTLVQGDDRQWALCLAVATGKTLWKTELAPEYRNAMGDGPRGAPTIADGVAYVYTGEGVLLALNVSDGKVAWRKALVEELQGTVADYGMAC